MSSLSPWSPRRFACLAVTPLVLTLALGAWHHRARAAVPEPAAPPRAEPAGAVAASEDAVVQQGAPRADDSTVTLASLFADSSETVLSPLARDRVYLRVLPMDEAPVGVAPGVHPVAGLGHPAAVAVLTPFRTKLGASVRGYEVGYWPAELHTVSSTAYANPAGFIEVTPETQDTPVSAHFRLRDFVTRDAQAATWPKVVVLQPALLEKLELVLDDLTRHGVAANHAVILSGFRTPAHNLALGDASGRARESRHQFGDAADLIIDADGDGRMDDLDGDGRVDARDVRVVEAAVDRVERTHPELAGGLGLYEAQGPSGPFAHIDVRGWVARWRRDGRSTATQRAVLRLASLPGVHAQRDLDGRISVRSSRGQCSAPPEFVMLCQKSVGR